MTEDDLRLELKKFVFFGYKFAKDYANEKGVSPAFLSAVICGVKRIPDSMLADIGYKRESEFKKII